jgi:hypothetical protein
VEKWAVCRNQTDPAGISVQKHTDSGKAPFRDEVFLPESNHICRNHWVEASGSGEAIPAYDRRHRRDTVAEDVALPTDPDFLFDGPTDPSRTIELAAGARVVGSASPASAG